MGLATDRLVAHYGLLHARKLVNTVGFGASAVLWLMVPMSASPMAALGGVCAALTVHVAVYGGYEASKLDIAAPEHVGLLQSLVNTMANTSGLVAVPLAAWIVERKPEDGEMGGGALAGWDGVFRMMAALFLAAAAAYLGWATEERLFT